MSDKLTEHHQQPARNGEPKKFYGNPFCGAWYEPRGDHGVTDSREPIYPVDLKEMDRAGDIAWAKFPADSTYLTPHIDGVPLIYE